MSDKQRSIKRSCTGAQAKIRTSGMRIAQQVLVQVSLLGFKLQDSKCSGLQSLISLAKLWKYFSSLKTLEECLFALKNSNAFVILLSLDSKIGGKLCI